MNVRQVKKYRTGTDSLFNGDRGIRFSNWDNISWELEKRVS